MINEIWKPGSLIELLEMRQKDPQALLMAGGTDVLVWLRDGRKQASRLILCEQVPELQFLEGDAEGLRIGAGVRIQTLLDMPGLANDYALLHQALRQMASPAIRHMATLGGNICSASPAGDSLPPLYAYGASLELASARGSRRLALHQFIKGPGSTSLKEGEVLAGIYVPRPAGGCRSGFIKVGRRQALAISIASLAFILETGPKDRIDDVRLAWGSVGPTVMRLPRVEEFLTGQRMTRQLADEAARMASEQVAPIDDIRATAAYRRLLAGRLLYYLL